MYSSLHRHIVSPSDVFECLEEVGDRRRVVVIVECTVCEFAVFLCCHDVFHARLDLADVKRAVCPRRKR